MERFDQRNHVFAHVGDIIRVETPPEKVSRKGLGHIEQRYDPFLSPRLETAPLANILLRPEEIHGASGIGDVFEPVSKGNAGIGDQAFWFSVQHRAVLHFHSDRRAAIKARRIDPDRLSRKKPADRQRFEPSLAEPFLLAVYCDTVLGREVVKGGKRGDVIGVWVKPSREHR